MPDIFGSNDSILCGERVMKRNRGCRGPILNTRVHHRWGAHSWLPGSLIKLKISIQTSDFWVNQRIHIGGVWGGDGQWEAGDSEISICWRLGGASATVQTLLTTMETLECMLRSDWGLLSCFICTKSGHKEVSSYPGQLLGVSLRMWDLMRRVEMTIWGRQLVKITRTHCPGIRLGKHRLWGENSWNNPRCYQPNCRRWPVRPGCQEAGCLISLSYLKAFSQAGLDT